MNRILYKLINILLPILVIGCTNKVDQLKEQQLKDTIEKLRVKADFKPLNRDEAYRFLNEYYLPRLDTLPSKRKIFVHSITGIDFRKKFENAKKELELKYSGDSTVRDIILDPSTRLDSSFKWDAKRLMNTQIIQPNKTKKSNSSQSNALEEFIKRYGYGYVYISYPQYNDHTKMIVIKEWIENGDWCGTGREQTLSYKVPNDWKAN